MATRYDTKFSCLGQLIKIQLFYISFNNLCDLRFRVKLPFLRVKNGDKQSLVLHFLNSFVLYLSWMDILYYFVICFMYSVAQVEELIWLMRRKNNDFLSNRKLIFLIFKRQNDYFSYNNGIP